MNRTIIEREIAFWVNKNPFYNNYFRIGFISRLIDSCEVVILNHPLKEKLIVDFISGLALYPIYIKSKNEQYGKEFDMLTKPICDLIIKHVTSKKYRKELIDNEISGESLISRKKLLRHIKRTNATPLVPKDISAIERDWIEYKLKPQPILQPKPEIKPIFNPKAINTIFDLLKDFFSKEHQTELIEILQNGSIASTRLIFLDNGNRLADAFKQLIKADIITGCEQKELEAWIQKNFNYRYRNIIKAYTPHYLNDIISTNKILCKNPILEVTKDKVSGKNSIRKA